MLRTGGARACLAQKVARPAAISRTGATALRAEVSLRNVKNISLSFAHDAFCRGWDWV